MNPNNGLLTVLFRAEISDEPDLYVEELKKLNIEAVVIPVMTFQYYNLIELKKALQEHDSFQGIIFTSSRAVKAIEQVFQKVNNDECIIPWRKKTNFAVGNATKKMAESRLNLKTYGDFSGNSEALGELISKDFFGSEKPFLFPCAKNRRDTILKVLNSNGIGVQELVCYESIANTELKDTWENVISSKKNPEILVFFSPSGVQFVSTMFNMINRDFSEFEVLAIGPATSEELCKIGCKPWAVASKPTPKDLSQAISTNIKKLLVM